MKLLALVVALLPGSWTALAQSTVPAETGMHGTPLLEGNTERPLRYWPQGTDFVITNGAEFFNRPLYCMNSAFRIDGGDKPEISLYLPGRGGNLRLGVQTDAGAKWLNDAAEIVARYRPGSLIYSISDPSFGTGELTLSILPLASAKGCVLRFDWNGASPLKLMAAFGGANEMRGARNGDIGCEREPVAQFFQLRPEQCRGAVFTIETNTFTLAQKSVRLFGVFPVGAKLGTGDATKWSSPEELLASAGSSPELPVMRAEFNVQPGEPAYVGLEQAAGNPPGIASASLPELSATAEAHRCAIAERVTVDTPDPFINAAAAALCVAGDAIWDAQQQSYMHGAVAWRTRLLGWRGPYTGDELGWHDRTAAHFAGFAKQQNTQPVPERMPPADEDSNLARSETALHSNGDLIKSHYDMNLVAVDAFFRHLLWTGDLDYARKMWPVIERHFAWERRLFRREFGPDKLPLYEAYCDIWASDNMQYEGGGVTYASAYNEWHNRMAARVARMIGKDPVPYEREADLINKALHQYLWLLDRGWFGEYKDYLGLQQVHPNGGLWTFYHTVDSGAATPFEAWQMSRYVDTEIAHIPIHGPGVPDEQLFTLPETDWMPYMWSLNNVVMAEVAHTSLAYWEANRPDVAFRAFKGCLMDSMYLGLCPGNLGCMTHFDVARGEAQRDFADACGTTSRALVEGLFGIHPDLLAGVLTICPGWSMAWDRAAIHHPDFSLVFRRDNLVENYEVETKFEKPVSLRLRLPALRDTVAGVTVNGRPMAWQMASNSVGLPRIEIQCPAALRQEIVVTWSGSMASPPRSDLTVERGNKSGVQFNGAELSSVSDPEAVFTGIIITNSGFQGRVKGSSGHRAIFARLNQGSLSWWQPVGFKIQPTPEPLAFDWQMPLAAGAKFETVNLSSFFNDRVTQIFRNEYRSPRSPFCSLAIPKQGLGGWCDINAEFKVDDSGLRAMAGQNGGTFRLPDGIPFATPGGPGATNIAFTSQWDNYPRQVSVPLAGRASHAFLLMAGSSNPMQSQFDNAEVIVTYTDGSTQRLPLRNPTNWWPIDQDYLIDDYGFRRPEPIPPRVDLKTGRVRLLDPSAFKGRGGKVSGGAANVLELPLDPAKELKSLTLHTLANEVVIGLMAVTLER